VRRRPDVRAAEAELHAANAAIGVAAARLYPSLSLTGSITQESLSAARLFSSDASGGLVTAGLTAPIFHSGALRSQRREAVAAYDEAAARYRRTVLTAVGQTADVLQALDHDAEAIAAEGAAVDAGERAVAAAQAQLAAARIEVLQVLKARQELGEARIRQAAARAQRFLDTVELHVALGGGGVN
jgi:outer membrane protein TolC